MATDEKRKPAGVVGGESRCRVRRATVCMAAIAASLGLALAPSPVAARGSFRLQEPWSGDPISRLPAEVRSQVTSVCRAGAAKQAFAAYYSDRIVLHYQHLHCGDRPVQCGANGCLNQVYSFEHGGWHLIKSYYGAGE